MCYALNVFSKYLLEALGYDIYWIGSDVGYPCNHILTVVNNLKTPGDKFLVDVGFGVPNFEPIPIEFESESPVYAHSYARVKYVFKGGKLIRCHKSKRCTQLPQGAGDTEWKEVCITDEQLEPRQGSYFDEVMEKVYSDPNGIMAPFGKSIRAIKYRADLKCVALKDSSLLIENDSHDLEEVKLRSVQEIVETVDTHFPLLSEEARKAVKNLKFDF